MNKIKLMKSVMGVVEEVSNLLAPCSCLLALTSSLLALLLPQAAEAQYIQETMTLEKGWNAIYLESTPDAAACSEFFKDMPVTKVMMYRGRDYVDSPKLDDKGRELLQLRVLPVVVAARRLAHDIRAVPDAEVDGDDVPAIRPDPIPHAVLLPQVELRGRAVARGTAHVRDAGEALADEWRIAERDRVAQDQHVRKLRLARRRRLLQEVRL